MALMTTLPNLPARVMLLFTTTGYEARDFIHAAQCLGVATVLGSDRCHVLDDPWHDTALPLRFEQPQQAVQHIVDLARSQPIDAILPIGDTPVLTAALASEALGLQHNPAVAAAASRNKFVMRQRLQAAGLRVPTFACYPIQADPHLLKHQVPYPCVVKPLALSASRGVIRANTPEEFVAAFWRLQALLRAPEIRLKQDEVHEAILVERFIPGFEVALEGLLTAGRLHPLALFDKPDPLNGPFFEETLYITPSRLSSETQEAIVHCTEQAARALGLVHGPLHAELRINADGPWILELAGRAIGGL
jgi:biotin carboxylase